MQCWRVRSKKKIQLYQPSVCLQQIIFGAIKCTCLHIIIVQTDLAWKLSKNNKKQQTSLTMHTTHKLITYSLWHSRNNFPLLSCSIFWRIVWAVVNPQLDSCKHINTLCGIFLLYPSLNELPSIEVKRALQDVSQLGYLFLDKSSLHIVAWNLDVERSQL